MNYLTRRSFTTDAVYGFLLYFDYWFMRRRDFNVFPYISLCEMKRPWWDQFWADFIFIRALYKPWLKDVVRKISEYLDS